MSEPVPTTNFSASWTRVDAVFGPLKLRAGLRVLDAGCGTGDYLRIMAPLVAPGPAVGIDLSATLIAHAQQRAPAGETNVSFRVGDAYDLPFPDCCATRCTTASSSASCPGS